jgi:hypothetical protein
MDPISATFGAISVLSTAGEFIQSSRTFAHNYTNAQTQIRHAECQWAALSSTIHDLSLQINPKHAGAQTSFEAIRERIPGDLRADSKMARIRYAAKQKGKVAGLVSQLKDTEISTTLALQLEQSCVIISIQESIRRVVELLITIFKESHRGNQVHRFRDEAGCHGGNKVHYHQAGADP